MMKSVLTNVLLAVVSLVVFFSAAEGLARLKYSPGEIQKKNAFEYDEQKLYRLKSNFTGRFPGYRVGTNSYGYRDTEFPVERPQNTLRAVVLGDSVSFGHGVHAAQTFPERLEDKLNGESDNGARYEVINTAAPGNSTFQEYYDLERALRFDPSVAIVEFTLNDVVEPFWVLRKLGGTGWDYHDVEDVPYYHHLLKENSAFYMFLSDMAARLRLREPLAVKLEERAKKIEEYDVEKLVYASDDPKIEAAWQECLAWMQKLVDLAKRKGIDVVLLASPFKFQLALEPEADLPQQKLREFAQANDILYVDLLHLLRDQFVVDYATHHPQRALAGFHGILENDPGAADGFWSQYFLDADHYSPRGHALVAQYLYPTIKTLLDRTLKEQGG